MPSEPEVHGLAALVELQASRLAARAGPDGPAWRATQATLRQLAVAGGAQKHATYPMVMFAA